MEACGAAVLQVGDFGVGFVREAGGGVLDEAAEAAFTEFGAGVGAADALGDVGAVDYLRGC